MGKVMILGAGATAGYDKSKLQMFSPTAKDFFQKSMILIQDGKLKRARIDNLLSFILRYYGMSATDLEHDSLDIEEVLTILDYQGLIQEHNELLEMIYLTLNNILYGESCSYHQCLVKKLGIFDTIISFNWDILVDNALASRCENNEMPNYGIQFYKTFKKECWQYELSRKGPKLLKLHGSLNWLECIPCKSLFCYVDQGKIVSDQIINPSDSRVECPRCSHKMTPMIVPPTLFKDSAYQKGTFKILWEYAEESLRNAEEIVIIGYSLPLTDFKAKWLFLKSIAERVTPLKKITVVDKYPNGLFEKYKKIFQVEKSQIEFKEMQGDIKNYVN